MHVCLTIPGLSKINGGTATVVQHLSEHLAQSNATVTVFTQEAAPGQSEVLPRNERVKLIRVPANRGWKFGGEFKEGLESAVSSGKIDLVHDFGLWLPANHAVVSACENLEVPLVCSPSGMLAPWALRHKAWKKRLAWWLYQRRDLSRVAILVATAAQEVQDVRGRVPGKSIALIPNGVELPPENGKPEIGNRKSENVRTLLFLGRIHPVKGLKNLVAAWNLVRPEGWNCIVAGPDQAGHQKELETLLRSYNLEKQFHFPGLVDDGQKMDLLKRSDVFVLPSFTENFGMVVAEALSAGVPVIATKGAPWAELGTHRCGWWIDIGVEPLAAALHEATSLTDPERQAMGQRGRRLVLEKYSWPQVASEMLGVYEWVAGKGPRPSCVNSSDGRGLSNDRNARGACAGPKP